MVGIKDTVAVEVGGNCLHHRNDLVDRPLLVVHQLEGGFELEVVQNLEVEDHAVGVVYQVKAQGTDRRVHLTEDRAVLVPAGSPPRLIKVEDLVVIKEVEEVSARLTAPPVVREDKVIGAGGGAVLGKEGGLPQRTVIVQRDEVERHVEAVLDFPVASVDRYADRFRRIGGGIEVGIDLA